jgi:hypothetical protein
MYSKIYNRFSTNQQEKPNIVSKKCAEMLTGNSQETKSKL